MLGRRMYLPIFTIAFLIAGIQRQCLGFGADEYDDDGVGAFDQILNTNDAATQGGLFSLGNETGRTLLEGDIVVTDDLLSQIEEFKTLESNGLELFDAIKRGTWPGGVVYYNYAGQSTKRRLQRAVYEAVKEYHSKTCIRWKEFSGRSPSRNYVTFFIGGGCYSMIGVQTKPQKISLGRGCATKGVAIHEMMHALGFYHEQSRRDRDNYITIYWNNINRRMWYNFQKYRVGAADTLGERYDTRSIMHYGAYAFSKNRQKTIYSKQGVTLGQRRGLSVIDVRQLNKYYKCSTTGGGGKGKPKPKPTGCRNNYPFCSALSAWCKKGQWVKKYCKKTCKKCPKKPPPTCKDASPNCAYWSKRNYCKNPTYKLYMGKTCKRSCNAC